MIIYNVSFLSLAKSKKLGKTMTANSIIIFVIVDIFIMMGIVRN